MPFLVDFILSKSGNSSGLECSSECQLQREAERPTLENKTTNDVNMITNFLVHTFCGAEGFAGKSVNHFVILRP